MTVKIATISSKGQITIPRNFQLTMNVTYGQRVMIYPDKDTLIIKPLKGSIVQQTAGSLKRYVDQSKLGVPFPQVRKETQKIVARHLAKKT